LKKSSEIEPSQAFAVPPVPTVAVRCCGDFTHRKAELAPHW